MQEVASFEPLDLPPNFDQLSEEEKARTGAFVEMPRGFSEPGKVLKLKKSLHGLRQSPRNFFHYLSKNLQEIGFTPATEVDPCLFISDKVMCLTYVDDCLLFAREEADIQDVINRMKNKKMDFEEEEDVAGFLGVHIERTDEHVKLTQKGLTMATVPSPLP